MTTELPQEVARVKRLLPFQVRWLVDRNRLKLAVKSRRVGGSYMASLDGAWKAAGYDICAGVLDPHKGEPVNIVSASFRQAKEFLELCVRHLRTLEDLPDDIDRVLPIARREGLPLTPEVLIAMVSALDPRPAAHAGNIFAPRRKRLGGQFKLSTVLDGEPTAEQIRLVGGVSIRAFAANPRTFRGFEGHVILDEGGVMPFFDRIWAAAAPIITRTPGAPQGYTVSVIGTPCGDGNKFYRLAMTDEGKAFSRHRISIYDAISQGHPMTLEEAHDEVGHGEIFEQEYNCAFLSAANQYLGLTLLDSCTFYPDDPTLGWQYRQHVSLHRQHKLITSTGGLDVANAERGDKSALVLNDHIVDRYWCDPAIRRGRGIPFKDQEQWVDDAFQQGCWKVAIDATGMGRAPAESLCSAEKHGDSVMAVYFNSRVKEVMATRAKQWFEQKKQMIPDDDGLRRGLLNLHRTIGKGGNRLLFDTKRDEEGGHGDEAWALMLSQHAADVGGKGGSVEREFRSRGV